MRLWLAAVATMVMLLCLTASALAQTADASSSRVTATLLSSAITVHYSGHFETQWPTSTSTADPKGIPGDFARAELDWKAVAQITYNQLDQGIQVHWHYLQLYGTFDYTLLPESGSPGLKCREVLTEVPGYEKTSDDSLNLSYDTAEKKYEVYASTPFNNRAATTGKTQDDKCSAFAYWPEPPSNEPKAAAFIAALQPSLSAARGTAVSKQWPDKTWNVPTQDAYDSVRATLTISTPR